MPVDQKVLAHVVQRALDSDAATLDTWRAQRIDYANVSPHSRGLYRVIGTARDGEVSRAWSLVLKVFAIPTDGAAEDPSAAFYWKREVSAYQSGFLADLPDGLAAPRCFGVVELSNSQLGLWLEDVQPPSDVRWAIRRYGLAARHFGAFGGAYLVERSIPAAPWLSRHVIRAWVAESAALVDLIQRPGVWTHPLLQRTFSEAILTAVVRLWNERHIFLQQLDQMPQTICHQDVWRKNLFTRPSASGQAETVAVDWELVGVGAAGEDVGNLLGVSLLNFDVEVDQAPLLAEAILTQYLEGLREAGWQGDPQAISYAFNIAAVLRCVFSTVGWPAAIMHDESKRYVVKTEQRWGRPIE